MEAAKAMEYKVIFRFGKDDIDDLIKEAMISEFYRVYNIYCEIANNGVTDRLNKLFDTLHPDYKMSADFYENVEYIKFMADGYQKYVVDSLNASKVSPILDFFVDPEEANFMGRLKWDHNATIDFVLKQV